MGGGGGLGGRILMGRGGGGGVLRGFVEAGWVCLYVVLYLNRSFSFYICARPSHPSGSGLSLIV